MVPSATSTRRRWLPERARGPCGARDRGEVVRAPQLGEQALQALHTLEQGVIAEGV